MLEIRKSPLHGKGVFATESIPRETLVETCEVALVHQDWELPESLATLEFPWDEEHYAICLSGMGSFFNHTKDFNVIVKPDFVRGQQTFIASRPIEAGEELCFYYNDAFEAYVNKMNS